MPDLMEYIKIQWTDIHHSRNQEWRILAIIGAAIAALLVPGVEEELQVPISVFGIIASIMGVYTSIAHSIIFLSKMSVIRECERELGIEARFRSGPVPVQSIIILAFFLLSSALSGWLAWLLSLNLLLLIITFSVIFIAGFWLCVIPKSPLRKYIESSDSTVFRLV